MTRALCPALLIALLAFSATCYYGCRQAGTPSRRASRSAQALDPSETALSELYSIIKEDKATALSDRLKQVSINRRFRFTSPELDAEQGAVSCLYVASRLGSKASAAMLIQSGADPAVRSERKAITPLMIAARFGHTAVCHMLVAAGADVNSKDGLGQTPLFAAAGHGHIAVCEFLLSSGANVEQGGPLGATPAVAIFNSRTKGKRVQLLKLLKSHGANLHVITLGNVTLLGMGITVRDEDAMIFLVDNHVPLIAGKFQLQPIIDMARTEKFDKLREHCLRNQHSLAGTSSR